MELKVISRIPESNLVRGEDIVSVSFIEGKVLAAMNTKENNGYVKVFSPDLHLLFQDLWAHECAIYHMTSGQGSQFYTSGSDSTIRQWGLDGDGQFILQDILRGHHEPPWKLRFDLQTNRLYSGDSTGQVRMWEDGEEVGCLGTVEEIWDMLINDGILFTTRHLDVYLTCFKTNGNNDEKMTWSIKNTIPGRGPLLICTGKLCLMTRDTYEIAIHDLIKSGNPLLGILKGHEAIVSALVMDSNILYSGGYDGKVIAWDFNTFEKLAEVKLEEGYVTDMTFDHKSGVLYAAGENRFICALKLERIISS